MHARRATHSLPHFHNSFSFVSWLETVSLIETDTFSFVNEGGPLRAIARARAAPRSVHGRVHARLSFIYS